jgi:uncharacterized protein YidB (DUF937 family)
MGLLDSVIGALGQPQGGGGGGQADLLGALIGMLGQGGGAGGAGGAGGLGGLGAGLGGLAGLVAKFQQAGLGEAVGSWVGTGQNLPVSADQISSALGSDTVARLAEQAGLGHGDVAHQLSQMLPQLVDKLTPNGQMPQGGDLGAALGAGGLDNLAGMLGGFLKR